ncbi:MULTISPECIES: arabinosyltransferase domain-containing protein [unclassified Crossiella]|uniref:arabinosyltransferase domain-containing protein n=1 Tax=unclassified Crossiella TaxID=2620835 RepID=UPI00200030AF|nr:MULTISPECIES: arabinosyltransferase domain-containing protein [unclassified Crossiella]MCK2237536.1 arabinosyltransferase domain-containing protein [Crossiella sp. S99.2]MCK2254822.1 arabinosyltransferase domain-containing protein [Crossiella sp. S99.1]
MARRWPLLLATFAVLTGLVLPLLPVRVADPVVSWPKPGGPAESTVALFVPYRPLRVELTVSCAVLREPRQVTVFATFRPADADGRLAGLYVSTVDGRVQVAANGREVFGGPVGGGACQYLVTAVDGRISVRRDGVELAAVDGLVPQVAAFVTELPPALATGRISLTAHADARFQASPTLVKYLLLALSGLLALACAVLLLVRFRRKQPRRLPRPGVVDLVVPGVLAGWALIGPMTTDDGFYVWMARNVANVGYVGNYYHWFNVPEAPFGTLQRFYAEWGAISLHPLWLRLPAVLAGVLSFWLLCGVLRRIQAVRPSVHAPGWLLAAAFLCWWLPLDLGVRPEPQIALATAVTAYAAVRARLDAEPAWLALAALVAGVAVTITPSGLLALVPPLLVLPAVLRALPARDQRITLCALLIGAGSIALPLVFAEVSLGALLEATAVHGWYGAHSPWYLEIQRYQSLLGGLGEQGNVLRRVPVLLGVGALLLVAVLRTRHRGGALAGAGCWPYAWLALGFGVLALTPSKWTQHFGALAVFGALALACAFGSLPRIFAEARAGWLLRLGSLLLVVLLLGVAWHGPNWWWSYSDRGMPFRQQELFGGVLGNPLVLLAIGLLSGLLMTRRRPLNDERGRWIAVFGWAAAGLARVSMVFAVLLLIGLFGFTAVREPWSLRGSCGIGDAIRVRTDREPMRSTETATVQGFLPGRGYTGEFPPPPRTGPVWGSFADLDRGTGTLNTGWHTTTVAPGDVLVVSAAGLTGRANALRAEVELPGAAPVSRSLDDELDSPEWRDFVLGTATESGIARVRISAVDNSIGRGGWLAVSTPGREHTHPLAADTGPGDGPTLVDWPISFALPCARPPVLAAGLAEPPARILLTDEDYTEMAAITRDPLWGGAYANLLAVAKYRGVSTHLPGRPWGRFVDVAYDYRLDGHAVRVEYVTRPGWWRGPSIANKDYSGRTTPTKAPR